MLRNDNLDERRKDTPDDAIGLRQQVANITRVYVAALDRIGSDRAAVDRASRTAERFAHDAVTCCARRLIHAGAADASRSTRRVLADELRRRNVRDPDAALRSAGNGPVRRITVDDRERAALSAVLVAAIDLRRDVRERRPAAPHLSAVLPRTLDAANRSADAAVRTADIYHDTAVRYLGNITDRAGGIVSVATAFTLDYGNRIERERITRGRRADPDPALSASWADWANIGDRIDRVGRACRVRL